MKLSIDPDPHGDPAPYSATKLFFYLLGGCLITVAISRSAVALVASVATLYVAFRLLMR
jgi:hypothetical protein